jgi:hypothetical protein
MLDAPRDPLRLRAVPPTQNRQTNARYTSGSDQGISRTHYTKSVPEVLEIFLFLVPSVKPVESGGTLGEHASGVCDVIR